MSLPHPRPCPPTAPPACRRSRPSSAALAALALSATLLATAQARDKAEDKAKARHRPVAESAIGARGGASVQVGVASIYSRKLAGRRMANGVPLRLDRHHAASTTLPLGSTALVTNLANGKSAMVTITDRGPFVRGRIIDLTPLTAMQLGIGGLGKVEVARIAPLNDRRDTDALMLADAADSEDRPSR
jgi:rare lipoprotein A